MNDATSNQVSNNEFDVGFFVDSILAEEVFNGLEEDVKQVLRQDMVTGLELRIKTALLKAVPLELLPEFDALSTLGDDTKTQEFCAKNIPNMVHLIADEMLAFRANYIEPKLENTN